jgi:putative glutamine transport system substrate-binding protein
MKSLLTILLLNALLMTQASAADEVLARIRERDRLIVSVKNEGNPARAAHKDPAHFNKRDFELAIARALAAKLLGDPAKLEIKLMRKPERVPAVVDGRVDLAISMLRPSAGLREQVDFSRPYFEASSAVMQQVGGAIRTAADVGGRRIGVIARNDAGPAQAFDDIGGGRTPEQIVEFDSFDQAAVAIEAGTVDGLLSEAVNIDVYLAGHPGRLSRSRALSHSPVAVAVPKDNPALLELVDAVIAELETSGELKKLQQAQGLLPTPAP